MFNFPWAMRDSLCCGSLERLSAAMSSDCTASQQAGEGMAASQPANGAATPATAPVAGAAAVQAEAAESLVPMASNAIQAPDATGSEQPADHAEAELGACSSAAVANGLTNGTEVASDEPQLDASTTALQTAQTPIDSGAIQTAKAINETADVPSVSGAAPVQRPAADASLSEQNGNNVPAAGRTPRNMEPKRCITAVPPARLEQLRALVRPGFDSCIVAAPGLQPLAAVQRLLPFLAPSAFFVVFSPVLQPLAEAMAGLQAAKAATNLQLQV